MTLKKFCESQKPRDIADVKKFTFTHVTVPYNNISNMGSVNRGCFYEVFYSLDVTQMYIIVHRLHCE